MLAFFDQEQFKHEPKFSLFSEQSEKSCIGKNYNIIKISPYGQNNKVDSCFLL